MNATLARMKSDKANDIVNKLIKLGYKVKICPNAIFIEW